MDTAQICDQNIVDEYPYIIVTQELIFDLLPSAGHTIIIYLRVSVLIYPEYFS